MKELVDVHVPEADVIKLIVDTLHIPTPAALYEAFAPAEARRITRTLELHYTPRQGSWLNMASWGFAVLAKQCLDRRTPAIAPLCREIVAWQAARHETKTMITWRFSTTEARITLKRLYPSASRGEPLPEMGLMRAA